MEAGPSGAPGASVVETVAQVSEIANAPAPTPNPSMEELPASGQPKSSRSAIPHHVQWTGAGRAGHLGRNAQ